MQITFNSIGGSETIKGYVHLLSDVNTAANGKTKYFNFQMQTSANKAVNLVCYSPEKRLDLKQSQDKHAPLQIVPAVKSPKRLGLSTEQYTVQKKSKITPVKLDFDYDALFSNRYHTIQQATEAGVFTTVDVKVKVMLKPEEKELVYVRGTKKYKVDATVADETTCIKLALWETCIDKVQVGKSYHMQNCKVHIFNDTKFLCTNEKTIISEIEDIQDANLDDLKDHECVITAKCLGLEVNRCSTCLGCNQNISSQLQITDEMVTCSNCNISILASEVPTKLVCRLVLKTSDGKVTNYTAFNDAMQSFLNNIGHQTSIRTIDTNNLKLLLLKAEPQQMVVDSHAKVIAQFLKTP